MTESQGIKPLEKLGDTLMIGYATLGSNDLEKGAKFYDDFLGAFGGKRAFSMMQKAARCLLCAFLTTRKQRRRAMAT